MKNFLLVILSSLAIHGTALAQTMTVTEYTAEFTNSSFGDAPANNGLIFVKRCDGCDRTSVRFNAKTRFFRDDTLISAQQAVELNGQRSTLFFDPTSRHVTRVIYKTKKIGNSD